MNKAQQKFLSDYSHSPIGHGYEVIPCSEFWNILLETPFNVDVHQENDGICFHTAHYYLNDYIYIHYSVKENADDLISKDVFACRFTSDDMPLPQDTWDGDASWSE